MINNTFELCFFVFVILSKFYFWKFLFFHCAKDQIIQDLLLFDDDKFNNFIPKIDIHEYNYEFDHAYLLFLITLSNKLFLSVAIFLLFSLIILWILIVLFQNCFSISFFGCGIKFIMEFIINNLEYLRMEKLPVPDFRIQKSCIIDL
jgi:hypothetical protein